ncbi:YceI family protein [Nostoc ellipsosporum NOK]|jgi:polyisoprenoid-binding protein YceI|nr:YceI family protein [Nostoc ellipsosporum NOK]
MKRIIYVGLLLMTMAACNKKDDKDTSYKLDATTSKAYWKGSAPDHHHTGSLQVNGRFTMDENGMINGGSFTMPISSIENFDLQDPEKLQLLNHLKSADFFNMIVHPEAAFEITHVERYSGTEGIANANYKLTGLFSLIGQTHNLSFPIRISKTNDQLLAQAVFSFNRLDWGMGSFSDPTQGLYILPDINIILDIAAQKQ